MMSVRQMADAAALRQFEKDGLHLIDAKNAGRFLYLYFLDAAGKDAAPVPEYFFVHTMELDCVTERNARRNMKKLMRKRPVFSP